MTFAAGTVSLVQATSTTLAVATTAATGGTGPYTYAYYISTVSGFTPGPGNIVSGASGLSATITGLIPGTTYYVEVVATDTGASNVTASSAQLPTATLTQTQNINQFAQSPQLGQLDLQFDFDTVSALVDVSQVAPLYAGQAVKMVGNAPNGVPKIVACSANADNVFGFIKYDIKTVAYTAGVACELSMFGNVQYLWSTTAINRQQQVTLDLTTIGGVGAKVPSSGANIVGWAYDYAAGAGTLIRVYITTPTFAVA